MLGKWSLFESDYDIEECLSPLFYEDDRSRGYTLFRVVTDWEGMLFFSVLQQTGAFEERHSVVFSTLLDK